MVVFDISDPKTFQNVENWVSDLREKLRPREEIPIMLLANKYDKVKDKQPGIYITQDKIEEIVKRLGLIGWMYVSAKDKTNIKESVQLLLEEVLKNTSKDDEEEDPGTITVIDRIPSHQNDNFCPCIGGNSD